MSLFYQWEIVVLRGFITEDGQNQDPKPRSLPLSMLTARPLRKLHLKHTFPAPVLHSSLCRCEGSLGEGGGHGRESPADKRGPASRGQAPAEQAEAQGAPEEKAAPQAPGPGLAALWGSYRGSHRALWSLAPAPQEEQWSSRLSTPTPPSHGSQEPQGSLLLQVLQVKRAGTLPV